MRDSIFIKGAREHNLKNIDVEIMRDSLTVITGISGSGKSSLAFDTIFAEGQRRYVESLSSYARQFLGQMDKPDVDSIEGLSPAISIDQKTTSKNPRSTVGTVTEIYDYMRLLWARIGVPHCPICGREIRKQTIDEITDQIAEMPEGSRIQILAPVVRSRKGEHQKVFEGARKNGYLRVRVDGNVYSLDEEIKLDKNVKHDIEIVVDRAVVRSGSRSRITDSCETATVLSGGLVVVATENDGDRVFSQNYACPDCGVSIEEFTPRSFSFNNPYGACPECDGLGVKMEIDPDLVVPNKNLSLNQGAVDASGFSKCEEGTMAYMYFNAIVRKYGGSMDVPVKQLPKQIMQQILYGTDGEKLELIWKKNGGQGKYYHEFEGVIPNMNRRYKWSESEYSKADIERYMSEVDCPACGGMRLKKEMLSVTVGGLNISEFAQKSVVDAIAFLDGLDLSEREEMIAGRVIKEMKNRLQFLQNVGLEYLTISRSSGTLSGGESQRIRLATQIGSSLMGVLYILDEPSIGLHQRDNEKLIKTLKQLRDLGNTLIVVEHDEETMLAADRIIDIGPGAGLHGGYLIACGTPEQIMNDENSITGKYLSGKLSIPLPAKRRKLNGKYLTVVGAQANNLKDIDVKIPLGVITAVTGVSGSGKSSLINEIVYKRLSAELNGSRIRAAAHRDMLGIEHLDKVINIDQSPIGKSPRSNPATYTGLFADIRDLFSRTPDSRARGYGPGRYSFNVKGGRCEACQGDGLIKIEMHFLPDVYVPCEVCKGKRYNRETLEVCYKGKNINDVLEMTVEEALTFFEDIPRLRRKLQTLYDVGLSYIKLGQPSTTLSGGEAQRVKLATELSRKATGRTIYILDEPTTGLHMADVSRLIDVLEALADAGNTVVVIEHNMDVIKIADHIIDLGPEGGDAGGRVIAEGTPEQIAADPDSYTGTYLKKFLERGKIIDKQAAF